MSTIGDGAEVDAAERAVRAEVVEARARFLSTVAAMQERLSPSRLEKDAASRLKSLLTGTLRGAFRTLRGHPGALAAGGALLCLMAISRGMVRSRSERPR